VASFMAAAAAWRQRGMWQKNEDSKSVLEVLFLPHFLIAPDKQSVHTIN
jgi:hypothetical protein